MSCCVQSRIEGGLGGDMIEMRRAQLRFGDGLIAEEVSDLREDWMRHADQVLADEPIVTRFMRRSPSGGRRAAAAVGSARRLRSCCVS